jgi:hypothetical protein
MSKDVFEIADLKGAISGWLTQSKGEDDIYLTEQGKAYLNGYLQANNTISLIKLEKYNQLLKDYENLLNRYERLKKLKLKQNLMVKFIKNLFHK